MILVTVADDRYMRGGGRYGETQNKIAEIFGKRPEFGIEHHPYTWDDILKTDFYQQNKTLLDHTDPAMNGRAYKPYVIFEELRKIAMGDFLVYNDCTPRIWEFVDDLGNFDPKVIRDLCAGNKDFINLFINWDFADRRGGESGSTTHRNYTLNRCMDKMGLRFYEDTYQGGSGMICIRKTDTTMILVQEWLSWNCIDECCALGWAHLPDDYSFWLQEANHFLPFGSPGFKAGHRHDQSIIGLLLSRTNHRLLHPVLIGNMNQANFLQSCRPGIRYKFQDTNPKIIVGNRVENKQGMAMKVSRIDGEVYYTREKSGALHEYPRQELRLLK